MAERGAKSKVSASSQIRGVSRKLHSLSTAVFRLPRLSDQMMVNMAHDVQPLNLFNRGFLINMSEIECILRCLRIEGARTRAVGPKTFQARRGMDRLGRSRHREETPLGDF